AERSAQSGAHRHTFANPHGRVFEIGCFRDAPGCRVQGPALTEFSWFSGYAWRIALCGGCLSHLGWRFQGAPSGIPGPGFFGLILNHLIEIESNSPP
ncbi:MAG: cereblon family protein, partial [Desulfobacterales bacterium]